MNEIKILLYRLLGLLSMIVLCVIFLPFVILPLYILNFIGWKLDKLFNVIAGLFQRLYIRESELIKKRCSNISDYFLSKIEILEKHNKKD